MDGLAPSHRILLGPGPSMADPRVLRAMASPLLGQFDPEFTAIMTSVHYSSAEGPRELTAPALP